MEKNYFSCSTNILSKRKKETAKMIPHLAVSSFYLFLYHTLVDLFFFKTNSLHDIFQFFPCIPVVRTRKARILLKYFSAPESYVPVRQLFYILFPSPSHPLLCGM